MDIQQIKAARREMEETIQAAVLGAMETFYTRTGMYPHSIDVQMVETTTLGDREKRYADVSL